MGRDPYIGAVAKMVNAPDWKSGYGGSSPPRSTIKLVINKRIWKQLLTLFMIQQNVSNFKHHRVECNSLGGSMILWWNSANLLI